MIILLTEPLRGGVDELPGSQFIIFKNLYQETYYLIS